MKKKSKVKRIAAQNFRGFAKAPLYGGVTEEELRSLPQSVIDEGLNELFNALKSKVSAEEFLSKGYEVAEKIKLVIQAAKNADGDVK